jgi:hypothetical protein
VVIDNPVATDSVAEEREETGVDSNVEPGGRDSDDDSIGTVA